MELSEKQLEQIKKFANKHLLKNNRWHRKEHVEQTIALSKALVKKENADINKCIVIAWLHDIGKNKENKGADHGNESAKIARLFLKQIGLSEKDAEEICYAIKEHNKENTKKTKEAEIIWDADKLQAIGPFGLLRIYGYSIDQGKNQKQAYEQNIIEQKFYIKRFHTKTAKKIAIEKFKFMEEFDKHYKQILNGEI